MDNNSTDDTAERADGAAARLGLDYRRIFERKQRKHHALNAALGRVTTPLVVTVDADTHLQRESLTRLIVRLTSTREGHSAIGPGRAAPVPFARASSSTR